MKINCFPKILFGIYILMFCKLSFAFDETVAAKYNDIFTQNILSQEDQITLKSKLILNIIKLKITPQLYYTFVSPGAL